MSTKVASAASRMMVELTQVCSEMVPVHSLPLSSLHSMAVPQPSMGPEVLLKVDSRSPVVASLMVLQIVSVHSGLLDLSKYLLEPEVALLVDESVVEEDTVLVVDIGSRQLSDPLVGNTSISVSVDLGRDTPFIESQPQIPPWFVCEENAYQVLSASAPLHSLCPAGYDPMTLWMRSPVPLEIPSQRYSRPSCPEGIFPG